MKFDKDIAVDNVKEVIQQFTANGITLTRCAELITFMFLQEIARLELEIEEIEDSHITGGGWGEI